MTTTKERNRIARCWVYTGNHPSGKDYDRINPYQYNAGLVSFAAHIGDGGDYQPPLTYEMTKQIKVRHGRSDGFGHEVEVSAPKSVWDACREAWKADLVRLGYDPEKAEEIVNDW